MYRGSSGLLQKNHKIHNGAVDILLKKEYQCLRCNPSNEISISETDIILNLKDELSNYYKGFTYKKSGKILSISPTDTLISKIILGTLGCIPAYDRYFLAGLKLNNFKHFQFNQSSVFEIFNFLEKNISTFEYAQNLIKTHSKTHYPLLKIVDMYFWEIGYENDNNGI